MPASDSDVMTVSQGSAVFAFFVGELTSLATTAHASERAFAEKVREKRKQREKTTGEKGSEGLKEGEEKGQELF